MVMSRLLVPKTGLGSNQKWIVILSPTRFASTAVVAKEGEVTSPAKSARPGFFQRVAMRWNGVQVPGEAHAAKGTLFQDCDKLFVPPKPFPTVPKDYKEHPERDLANFPYPEKLLYQPKTRLLIVPDSWLRPIEKVTGTSGPYLFLGTVTAFLVNKEYLPYDENVAMGIVFLIMYYTLSRTFGYKVDSYMYKCYQEKIDAHKKIVDSELKDAVEFRKSSAAEAESLKAIHEKFPVIFKENLALQLEATYRRNVDTVANELKRRIDYLQEVEETKLRFERDILLKSIIQGVQRKIDTNEGGIKEAYLDNCISQLKTLKA